MKFFCSHKWQKLSETTTEEFAQIVSEYVMDGWTKSDSLLSVD